MSQNPTNSLPTIKSYHVKPSITGSSVKYQCPVCEARLRSSLMDADKQDYCPDCGAAFIVPGSPEKLAEAERRLQMEDAKTEAVSQRKELAAKAATERISEQARRAKGLHLDRDPLRDWMIYASVIATLLCVAAGIHLIRALVSDRSGLCLMIFVLFALAVLINFRSIRTLRNEYVCAAFLVRKLTSGHGFTDIVQSDAAGLFHQHIKDLVKIAKHDPSVSQDSLITLLYSRLMARSRMVDVLSGVLVSLGLIGTIVGLVSMTNGLSGTLEALGESSDASMLMSGMRSTMQGLGTAFYTTLVGAILGSVVLRVLNNVYTSNVDHFVSYIASLTEVRIIPRLRKRSRTEQMEGSTHEVA